MADAVKFVYVGQPAPPGITSQPQSKTTNQGFGVTFSVAATGTPPLTYQWQFNGVNIGGATTNTYNARQRAGCRCGQLLGGGRQSRRQAPTSANAVLTVNTSPAITAQPADQSVRAGSNATFTVTATGMAPMTYQWRFNGTVSPRCDPPTTYTRANAQTNQAGNYSVVITNSLGFATSSNALLSVTLPQPAQFQSIAQLPDGTPAPCHHRGARELHHREFKQPDRLGHLY